MITRRVSSLLATAWLGLAFAPGLPAGDPVVKSPLAEKWDYVPPMKKVAARFQGNEGVVMHVGASDTIANPYTTWARQGKGKTSEDLAVRVHSRNGVMQMRRNSLRVIEVAAWAE
jgi:hypothetical protein